MENQSDSYIEGGKMLSPTLRDLLAVVFRHRLLITVSFIGIVLGATVTSFLLPPQYQAHMTILVKHERVDPVITSGPNTVPEPNSQLVTEQDLNTEVEMIKSRDLLVKVVKACGLQHSSPFFWHFLHPAAVPGENLRVAEAVRGLAKDLSVEPIKKSSMIEVSYTSSNPILASRVLTALAKDYLVKHLKIHRFPEAYDFFDQQAEQYHNALDVDEKRLVGFSGEQGQGAVSPHLQMDLVLREANHFDAVLWQARSLIAQTQERIRSLKSQMATTPRRVTTEDRQSDNPQLLASLRSSLATLELKRTELLQEYEPSYRLVKEVEAQIVQARAAIAGQKDAPVQEKSTNRNPTFQWLDEELAKANADLATYRAQAEATQQIIDTYRTRAVSLEQKQIAHEDLMRNVKVAETNYLLYLKKAEEANISNALDNKRIDNVAIAEAATVPPFPVHSTGLFLSIGVLLAALVSLGSAFVADYFDSSFRTADELKHFLEVPVLAAFPK
ncbi:MAG: GumC family protein, partial [Acidobacteriota bacterium]